MSSAPLFSIVTITLNCASDAEQTARGVLAQTCADMQYLVKDGGSTDGTPDRIRALGVEPIIQADTGVYSAMNQALRHCTGRYVCFMNAGDQMAGPDVLARVAERIRASGEPEFVYGDVATYSAHPELDGGGTPAEPREIAYPDRLSRFYLFRRMICHQAWFVRRDAYMAQGGFDERYRLLADYDMLMRLFAGRGVRYAHAPLVTAIFQGGGISERKVDLAAEERARVLATRFSSAERLLYGAAYYGGRGLARQLIYRLLYPILSPDLRKKLHGS
jgi:putative colanic acid biosynthesis glycosyltransferase